MSDKLHGQIKAGATSVSIPVLLQSASTFAEVTGAAAAVVTASYLRQGGTRTAISVTALGSVNAAYSSGGWIEVDGTNCPGLYRLDLPDAALASGADWVVIAVKVSGALVFYERFALETAGSAEIYARQGAPAGASMSADIAAVKTDTAGVTAVNTKLGTPAGASVSADVAAVKTDTAAIGAKTTNLPASPAGVGAAMTLTSGERDAIAAALLDLANGVETGITARQALRLIAAASGGKIDGAGGTTVHIRDLGDTKNRVTATVSTDGRSAVTLDLT